MMRYRIEVFFVVFVWFLIYFSRHTKFSLEEKRAAAGDESTMDMVFASLMIGCAPGQPP
jgi:hypothetical protein